MAVEGDSYDYIVTGAGSAGCVLAARLSESGRHRVLLLEAGGKDSNPWIHIPLGYAKTFVNPKVNWMFDSEPEPNLNDFVLVILCVFRSLMVVLVVKCRRNAIGVMCLVVDDQDVLPATGFFQHTVHQGAVALDVTCDVHFCCEHDAIGIGLFAADANCPSRLGGGVGLRGVVSTATRRRHSVGDDDLFLADLQLPRLHDARPAAAFRRARLEFVPVLDQNPPPCQVRHHRRRHKIARAIQARIAGAWIKLSQPPPDRHVGAHDQHRIGKPCIAAIRLLVQDRPCGQHRRHRALASTCRHLAATPFESRIAGGTPFLAGIVARDGQTGTRKSARASVRKTMASTASFCA